MYQEKDIELEMVLLYKKNQGCDWEYEIPDDKIVSVMPNDVSSVRVLYIDDYRIKEVICDKISFV